MNFEVANECSALSDEEKITFPEVIGRLMEAGIDHYYADLLKSNKTFYAENSAHTIDCSQKHDAVAATFDQAGVLKAIRQIQSGEIKYQEFIRKIMQSGVVSYMVFAKGRKAIYFGRNGEQHIEDFKK